MHISLNAAAESAALQILRDGSFSNLGFVWQQQERMLVFLESARFLGSLLRNPHVCAVLTTPELAALIPEHLAAVTCEQPRLAFATIHNDLVRKGFYWEDFETKIDPTAQVHPTAWVAANNVRIGPGTVVGPHATILERCVAGAHVMVGAGCVLGGVGFQTVRGGRAMVELTHGGGLTVEDGVQLLPGAVVATGLFREHTTLARDGRVGSQAFISHGVRVGERAFIGHGAVLNGGVRVGRDAWIGPGVVVAQTLDIGDEAFVSLGAAVIRDVPAKARVSGAFAISHRRMLRFLAEIESDHSHR